MDEDTNMAETGDITPHNVSIWRKISKKLGYYFFLPLCALLLLLVSGVYGYCWLQQDSIKTYIHQTLLDETGLSIVIAGNVMPELFPVGVVASDIVLQGLSPRAIADAPTADPFLHVASLRVDVDILALFTGSVRASLVQVEAPRLFLGYGKSGVPLWETSDSASAIDAPAISEAQVQAVNAHVSTATKAEIATAAKAEASVAALDAVTAPQAPQQVFSHASQLKSVLAQAFGGVEGMLNISPQASLETSLFSDNWALSTTNAPPIPLEKQEQLNQVARSIRSFLLDDFSAYIEAVSIKNASVDLRTPQGNPELSVSQLQVLVTNKDKQVYIDVFADIYLAVADLQTTVRFTTLPLGETDSFAGLLSGTVSITPYQSTEVEGTYLIPLRLDNSGRFLSLTRLVVEAEGDALDADFIIDLGTGTATGKANVRQLSLPRWFAFGRNLPPGIQHPLHAISGVLDVVFDGKGIHGYNLVGNAGQLPVTAYVGVDDLSAPVIRADVALPTANVDALLPFLATSVTKVEELPEPVFAHVPLAPFPEKPLLPGESPMELIDVGYDIRVYAQNALVHELSTGAITVLVQPVKDTVCRVSFMGENIAKGLLTGHLDIDYELVTMHFETKKVDLSLLPENSGSSVQVGGIMDGVFDIHVPVTNGFWAKKWDMKSQAEVSAFTVGSAVQQNGWKVYAKKINGSNDGKIHAVRKDGISITGTWKAASSHVYSSWNPQGKDTVDTVLEGTVAWPHILSDEALAQGHKQQGGIDRVFGKLTAKGGFTVRLGSLLVPILGVLQGDLDWHINDNTLTLTKSALDGLGSYTQADIHLLFTDTDVIAKATSQYKVGLRTLLKKWDLLPSRGIIMPELLTGTATIVASGGQVVFDPIVLEMDGAPLQGRIVVADKPFADKGISGIAAFNKGKPVAKGSATFSFAEEFKGTVGSNSVDYFDLSLHDAAQKTGMVEADAAKKRFKQPKPTASSSSAQGRKKDSSPSRVKRADGKIAETYWQMQLSGSRVDFDKIFPPNKAGEHNLVQEKELWDLGFLEGFNVDLLLRLEEALYHKMQLKKNTLALRLEDKRFGFKWDSKNFYSGNLQLTGNGWLEFPSAVVLEKTRLSATNFMLDKALYAYSDSDSYGGKANILFNAAGAMRCSADLPAALSGNFSVAITDGLYPAFLGSETAGLRNTFREAKVSGVLNRGLMSWNNFTLSSAMVDMFGEGWVDLGKRLLDIKVSVTFVKVPTVPVRFTGSFDSPSMYVRGAHMVLHTAQAAGSTVFNVLWGIVELPARAVRGVGDLFSSEGAPSSTGASPLVAPPMQKASDIQNPAPKETKKQTPKAIPKKVSGKTKKKSIGNK